MSRKGNQLLNINQTYCNPLPLPDYPRGGRSYKKEKSGGWFHKKRRDFRETADPSVLYYNEKWYLYPTCGLLYISEDFIHWKYCSVIIEGFKRNRLSAPTILHYNDSFFITGNRMDLFQSRDPAGPFKLMGPMKDPKGDPIERWYDPMLFADDDGAVYAYWGLGGPGIFGAQLDPQDLSQMIAEPKKLFAYNPEHKWERYGDLNENIFWSSVEGAWMFKHNNTYYLTYAAPGTELKTYAMGCYVSDKALGPFTYQKKNPILRDTHGLVHGPGHGCIVKGPKNTICACYTCLARTLNDFERRTGMDPAGIDKDGNLYVKGATETPQWAPGLSEHPEESNDAGLLPVSVNKIVHASSEKEGREPACAVDNNMRTWWESDPSDSKPWIEIHFEVKYTISGIRIMWAELGLDYDAGAGPGPVKYKILAWDDDKKTWNIVLNKEDNQIDLPIDYQTFKEVQTNKVRLEIIGTPEGIHTGIVNFTVFGIPGMNE